MENAEGYLLQRESMRWFWGLYLHGAPEEPDWRACPLLDRTRDLHAEIAREVRAALS